MKPTIYVARDIERALGMEPSQGYLVVANDGEYARTMRERYRDFVLLIKSTAPLDTFELLEKRETADFIEKGKRTDNGDNGSCEPNIMVFKSTSQMEEICARKGWRLLNPSAALAEKIENKITQAEWLGELSSLLPSFVIAPLKDVAWDKKPLIIQFAHAHTGLGTILVNEAKDLEALQNRFPDRPAKASEYIKGPVFTCNIVVNPNAKADTSSSEASAGDGRGQTEFSAENSGATRRNVSAGARGIILGNISYQITGLPTFTDSPFATVGNDWSLPHTILSERQLDEFRDIALKVAAKMRDSGWRGLFGIDVIYDEERDGLKLLEINARQPASASFESRLQSKLRESGVEGQTIFEAHLAALLGDTRSDLVQIELNDGAQVVQRVTEALSGQMVEMTRKVKALNDVGYVCIPYKNTKPNADLLRIQSGRGIMEKHGKFNKRGEEIVEILER